MQDAREEGLGEVEPRHPKARRFAVVEPRLEELEAAEEVCDVAAQRAEGGVPVQRGYRGISYQFFHYF